MDVSAPRVEVVRSARRRRTVTASREGDTIVVRVPARMSRTEERRHVEALVARLLAREARTRAPGGEPELLRRASELSRRYLAPELGEAPRPSRVVWAGNQRRRWGSCTPDDGSIRLSSRLQPMPAWVVDYVLLHELVHLVEAHHTPRFHALLARFPEAERARGYLEGYTAGSGAPGAADDGLVDEDV